MKDFHFKTFWILLGVLCALLLGAMLYMLNDIYNNYYEVSYQATVDALDFKAKQLEYEKKQTNY